METTMKYDFRFDEMHQVGADHADPNRANEYDSKMQLFRNYAEEAKTIAKLLNITNQMTVLDIGAGTGALSLELASYCRDVTAVDVSKNMLHILQKKAKERTITNIKTSNCGFLSFDNNGFKYDRIISNVVLHHLPDFWKSVALRRVHAMLNDNGLFFLNDVVFSFPIDDYQSELNAFLTDLEAKTDAEFVKDGILHIKEEFSTFDWILDLMIEKTGFQIENKNRRSPTGVSYVLKKAEAY